MYAIVLLLSLMMLTGCRQDDTMERFDAAFTCRRTIVTQECKVSDLVLGRPFFMSYADSCVLLYDDLGDSLFTLIDMADSRRVYRFGERGQGPSEFLQVASVHRLPSGFCVYDYHRHRLVRIDIKKVKSGVNDFSVLMNDTIRSIDMLPTAYGTYVGLGFYEKNMFSVLKDGVWSYFSEYPSQDETERKIPNALRGMAYQGTLCASPALDKLVYAVNFSPIFMIYTVGEDSLVKTHEWIGAYPIYQPVEKNGSRSAPMSSRNRMGFISTYATDRYVYLLYSGKSLQEHREKALTGNVIYQLDWDGRPVARLELDVQLSQFCVTDADDRIYAVRNEEECTLIELSLDE